MDLISFLQFSRLSVGFIAALSMALGFYILAFNPRHATNRVTGALFLLISLANLATSYLIGAAGVEQALWPTLLLAAAISMLQPLLLLTAVYLLRPLQPADRNRDSLTAARETASGPAALLKKLPLSRLLTWALWALVILPLLLTLSDALLGTQLWYTGLSPDVYRSGLVASRQYTLGAFSGLVRPLTSDLPALGLLAFLIYGFLHAERPQRTRIAALLLAHVASLATISLSTGRIPPRLDVTKAPAVFALVSLLYLTAYTYTIFQTTLHDRRLQRGRIQNRITQLVLAIIAPVLIFLTLYIGNRTATLVEQQIQQNLQAANRAMAASTQVWIDAQARTLQALAVQPAIADLDPAQQRPVLQSIATTHPEVYLASTTDLAGLNIARSDDAPLTDYSDRQWYQAVRYGAPLAYQTLIGRTSGRPALVVSTPIHDLKNHITGVVMLASDLAQLTGEIQASRISPEYTLYLVDDHGQLLAGPDPLQLDPDGLLPVDAGPAAQPTALVDLSAYPPVSSLQRGLRGQFQFRDQNGLPWQSYITSLSNGWGVIVQHPVPALQRPLHTFQVANGFILLFGLLALAIILTLTIRQFLQPINDLTDAALAITAGDLQHRAPQEGQDDLSQLARAFNSMTQQLSAAITGLEARVDQRTQELQRRLVQLQVSAEIARESGTIRDLDVLLTQTTQLISSRFGFYHAGVFLIDNARQYAVLHAASSEGGRRMLARHHRLRIGQVGLVGHVAAHGSARIAHDVGADAVYFDNPDMPETRSEAALPLLLRSQVIGVLDVQSVEPEAFQPEDLEILQIVADQLALAIENARLLTTSEQARQDLEKLFGRQVARNWRQHLMGRSIVYHFDHGRVHPAPSQTGPESPTVDLKPENPHTDQQLSETVRRDHILEAPLLLRGQRLGSLQLRRATHQPAWTDEERELITDAMQQVALALENARLLEEVQARANQEQVINQIAARAQTALDLDSLMKIAVQEIGQVLDVSRVQIRLSEHAANGGNGQAPTANSQSAER